MRLAVTILVMWSSVTSAWAQECRVLDDFKGGTLGVFPKGWSPRKAAGSSVYSVHAENDRFFVRASTKGLGIEADRQGG